ncbi:MAG TPA: hypothetical protein VFR33_13380 [Candidatus Dormibacteraeota bacterium]|nr:hypothetical protein [Candidatus Dormibacteraeota bacterium]
MVEREFVERATASEKAPKGWPAALVMFHVAMWRERMRNCLLITSDGGTYEYPGNRDEINDAELASGIGTPLSDAAARSGQLLSEIVELLPKVGDRPVNWFGQSSVRDAVLRNSYSHPRRHICDYMIENGDKDGARKLLDAGLDEMRALSAPDYVTVLLTQLRESGL